MSLARDTIFAIASPPGPAARLVLRLSGAEARPILSRLTGCDESWPRGLHAVRLHLEPGGQPLALDGEAWVMPGPGSYTGEDVVELHLPGAPALAALLPGVMVAAGARPAEAGAFTQRAFLSGRLDLSRAESVAALIHASDEEERQAALAALGGGLAALVERERERLLDWLVPIELDLDFADQDIDIPEPPGLAEGLDALLERLSALASATEARVADRQLPEVVLSGPANAGKSSLFNRLVAREAAIVSDERGTTRDVLRSEIEIRGERLVLSDVAGDDVTRGAPDSVAHQHRERRLAHADLVLAVRDGTLRPGVPVPDGALLVLTRADLPEGLDLGWPAAAIRISSVTGEGLEALEQAIVSALHEGDARRGAPAVRVLARHREAFAEARDAVGRAIEVRELGDPILVASDLRAAVRALDRITGRDGAAEVFDRIFAGFCIGK